MFAIGFCNQTTYAVASSLTLAIAFDNIWHAQVFQLMICFEGAAFIACIIHARFLLNKMLWFRVNLLFAFELIAWLLVFWAFIDHQQGRTEQSYTLASVACLISKMAVSFGNCINYGTLKALPNEMVQIYGCGLATSSTVNILCLFVLTHYGIEQLWYFLPLVGLAYVKQVFHKWFRTQMLEHSEHLNIYRLRRQDSSSVSRSDSNPKVQTVIAAL